MASPPESAPVNGFAAPPTTMSTEFDTGGHHSDSDLSDVRDVVVADPEARQPAASPQDATAADDAGRDAYVSDEDVQSSSTRDDASDDGDFDVDEGAPSPQSDRELDQRSASQSSLPSSNRKSPSEDTYIQQNPELYGLRRSVRQ